jgi:hypothetical protein
LPLPCSGNACNTRLNPTNLAETTLKMGDLAYATKASHEALLSNAIRNCPLCVTKNCPHPRVHDLG